MPDSKTTAAKTGEFSSQFLNALNQYFDSVIPNDTALTVVQSEMRRQTTKVSMPLTDTLIEGLKDKLQQLREYAESDYLAAHAAQYEVMFLVRELLPRLPSTQASVIESAQKQLALALEQGLLNYSGPAAAALLISRQPLAKNVINDASRMGRTAVHIIRQPSDEAGIIQALNEARELGLKLSISGARHSQGGQIASTGSLHLNLDNYRAASLDVASNLLTVQSGALWGDLIPLVDAYEKSLDVLQVPNYFSVGGTLSANAHGHNINSGPVASTVQSLRLLKSDGEIVCVSRSENTELFSLVLGGYGLFGVILDVVLKVRDNAFYHMDFHVVDVKDFLTFYQNELSSNPQVRYSHILYSVAQGSFLNEVMIIRYRELKTANPLPRLSRSRRQSIERQISDKLNGLYAFSGWSRSLAWWLASRVLWRFTKKNQTRNRVMNEPFTHFSNGRTDRSEMLQEYFIPRASLDEFMVAARTILAKQPLPLVMVAVRAVKTDADAFLSYALQDVFGIVFISHHPTTDAEFDYLDSVTRLLIDAALIVGGRFYLPYRLAYTAEQLYLSYPCIEQFFKLKRHYDPEERFSNKFFEAYGKD